MSVSANRRGLLAKIHIAQKELGLDDETYRAALTEVTRKNSAGKMTVPELERVLAYFRNKDWEPKRAKRLKKLASTPQTHKIRLLWLALAQAGKLRNGSDRALRSFVKRMTGVSAPEWLTPGQASTVIEALKAWCGREGVKR